MQTIPFGYDNRSISGSDADQEAPRFPASIHRLLNLVGDSSHNFPLLIYFC